MKYVSGIKLGLVISTLMLSACGRVSTVNSPSTSNLVYAKDTTGLTQAYQVNLTDGSLTLYSQFQGDSTNTIKIVNRGLSVGTGSSNSVTIGSWTYVLNTSANQIEVYASDNLSVTIKTYPVSTAISILQ